MANIQGGGLCSVSSLVIRERKTENVVNNLFFIHTVTACDCNEIGSRNSVCEQTTGQCSCHSSYGNLSCSECNHGYYKFPACTCNVVVVIVVVFKTISRHTSMSFVFRSQTVTAIRSDRCRKCATRAAGSAYAKTGTPGPGATGVRPATMGIRTASRAAVRNGEARRPCATRWASARVYRVSPAERANSVVQDSISIPSVNVSHSFWYLSRPLSYRLPSLHDQEVSIRLNFLGSRSP